MLKNIIDFSINNKLIVILFTLTVAAFGLYAVLRIPVGAVPDITNNQVQVITTSGNLSTQEIEQYITASVEMEMANLPGVKEIRSVSKFGISLVTIVFDENMGTYLPRQLIAEKIKSATAKIPQGFGEPEMGPITTGLGEIYQYTLDIKEGYENKYSATDLRTIQDWVIKRRLSGIKGVVEINSWGGYLKQYEVSINPSQLMAMDITLMEIFNALEANNSISGGSYLEKTNQSYFIRGDGQVKSIEDIENIVVKNSQGTPILIKNIASVSFGHANRYGAITANGKGETILGQVMMLKNANSKEVINEVKNRVAEIQNNLPEGVSINPIVDRSELVAKTSFTVVENLILGALIVMFTVILLLGNIRLALVITSVIPLALLFTIAMMYVFGIDANLMSLGALDFGIIIDGAVIIVEFIALKIAIRKTDIENAKSDERASIMDAISLDGASRMMKSAIFGQIIILIVFIPILSLTGVEGKMFKPMALSFCFAIIGAMIMGLTWIPVASSLFLKPPGTNRKNVSDWLMNLAHRSYSPVIHWACAHKRIVLGAALISLLVTAFLFTRIGGEFVPTLDEGDFVIQPVLKTGTSLSKTIETTTQMEQILINNFTEVDKIVSRIGAAEVPTDPMSMEEIDMIIKLKPRKTWTNAKSKEELADKFKDALSAIPGIEYEFTQPIEMRFNELITGVRSDIAIKIFGDDLEYIDKKAIEIKGLIEGIPGASDIILEKTAGLPQIKINYNRTKIAYYGVDIKTLNSYLATAFGGEATGIVFEGEKRFDLVVRFDKQNRTDIDDIRRLQVPLSNGNQIPLSELAEIHYAEGPAKISRENTHRRVVVSVNVRNRDLQSVVNDIRATIDKNITLKPGNYVAYGGQFENLRNATNRLLIAVPVALILIFIFLHFAFKSLKDAIMIFTAIPLATVGGVFLLWVRGMPFSVSAGVGFIALFGIAVLNGIVLIEHLKQLKHNGTMSMRELIIQGTKDRLRPVMLTAGAAAMGFLPMALSTGAGAEVQRPLATVVIGGLVTSTMLTMIALPLMFEIFYNVIGMKFFPLRFIRAKECLLILVLLLPSFGLRAQNKELTLDDAIKIALQNNKEIKAYGLKVEEQKTLIPSAIALDKTTFTYGTDQNNIAENNYPLKVWGIEQSFNFPTLYGAEVRAKRIEHSIAEAELKIQSENLIKHVSLSYIELQLLNEKLKIYQNIDSLYLTILKGATLKNSKGEVPNLDLLNMQAKQQKINHQLNEIKFSIDNTYSALKALMGYDSSFTVSPEIPVLNSLNRNIDSIPFILWLRSKEALVNAYIGIEKNKLLPDLSFNYFLGTNFFENAKYYHGFEAGLSIPLFFNAQKSKIKASEIAMDATNHFSEYEIDLLKTKQKELSNAYLKLKELLNYHTETGSKLYDEIIRTAQLSLENGEIDFFTFATSTETALQIQLDYFNNLMNYNSVTLELNYLSK
ncbi:MAG TPA: CusA/CzcA family heavy metal efflux RND transporter [Bacteroidales bacterium]|nr:CusA/CzcA family heavy metal efflux RND transporter [Bacteroidales bacterium]HNS46150.1 CusA/CzcA family heavy metal efflux RND transporter [Bacteroidales bacterium]